METLSLQLQAAGSRCHGGAILDCHTEPGLGSLRYPGPASSRAQLEDQGSFSRRRCCACPRMLALGDSGQAYRAEGPEQAPSRHGQKHLRCSVEAFVCLFVCLHLLLESEQD